jgi:CRP-like cAMP-binding protein
MRKFGAEDIMVGQGTKDREMYVLLEGRADVVVRKADGSSLKVAELAVGDVFGEIGLVAELPRTADVVALGPATTLVLSWPSMDRVARQFPRIASQLYRNISGIVADRLAEQLAARTSSKPEGSGNSQPAD